MKLTQKILALLLAVLMTLFSVACAGKDAKPQNTDPPIIIIDDAAAPDTQTEPENTESDAPETKESSAHETETAKPAAETAAKPKIDENGIYTSKEDVALYIRTYGKLPSNFITKKEAEKLGWSGGGLDKYAKNKCIGGSRFGNYEGKLPEKEGRTYTECDIDTLGKKSRGAKRIVFSDDGLIYYTEDHYETFELLYGNN